MRSIGRASSVAGSSIIPIYSILGSKGDSILIVIEEDRVSAALIVA